MIFFFPLKYWLNVCLGALRVLYGGQRFLWVFVSSSVPISVLEVLNQIPVCLMWR